MKFVFFGYDFSLQALFTLVNDGHEVIGIHSFPCDNIFSFNRQLKEMAAELGLPVSEAPITPEEIESYIEQGCEVFIAFGYKYKIPPIDEKKAYAINVHPSYLPRVRGIMPMPYIILEEPEAAGVTVHKMTQEYDAGDILFQKKFKIDHTTDIEILSSRAAISGTIILSNIMQDFKKFWRRAKPQKEKNASTYDTPPESLRKLDWNKPVADIIKTGKAFGHYGCIAEIEGERLAVFSFNGWQENHGCNPGDIALVLPYEFVVAASDGFICLKEYMMLPDENQNAATQSDE